MGIDFGAKLAGTTAVAMVRDGALRLWQSEKGKDADSWLLYLIAELQPKVIFLDAPLSLPKVYAREAFTTASDFFYRQADREVQAMSPMFIGGLTARAIKLRTQLAAQGIAVLETYPSQANRLLFPHLQGYKKSLAALPTYAGALQGLLSCPLPIPPANWHQVDAILAWNSSYRHLHHQAILYGDPKEGVVIV